MMQQPYSYPWKLVPYIAASAQLSQHAEFQLADAQPFGDDRFDGVAAAQVLCFLDDPDRALAEVCRVLKPGGRFVVLDTSWDTLVWKSSDVELMTRVMTAYTSLYSAPSLPLIIQKQRTMVGILMLLKLNKYLEIKLLNLKTIKSYKI